MAEPALDRFAPLPADANMLEVRAHRAATRDPIARVVTNLVEILGAQLVAYIGSVKETRAVREWMAGTRVPRGQSSLRLRLAYRVARCIAESDGRETAQAWFQGLNPLLGNVSPARLLRTGDLDLEGPLLLAAERHFLEN